MTPSRSRVVPVHHEHEVIAGTLERLEKSRLASRDLLGSVRLESTGGFEIGQELTVMAYLQGLRLGEVPTTWGEPDSGESKFTFR